MKLGPVEINKLHHIDCLELMKKLPKESIDLILTDPPYGVNFVPQREAAKKKYGTAPIANDEIQDDEWEKWFTPIAEELYRVLKNDSVAYLFSGYKVDRHYYTVLEAAGFDIKAVMIWVKNQFGLGYHFRRQYEKIVVAFKGKPPVPSKAISDVIFDAKVNSKMQIHSCQKPLPLLGILLRQYSNEGDVVLEPFAGSGSHLMACEKNNRNWVACEVDDTHFENADDRVKREQQQLKLF